MTSSQHWFMGLAPVTPMEHAQAATEAMYAAEDERERMARFDEAPDQQEQEPESPYEDRCVHCGAAYDGGHRCGACGNGDPLDTGEFDPVTGEQW